MKLGVACLALALLCCIVEAGDEYKKALDQEAQSDIAPHGGQDKANPEKGALNIEDEQQLVENQQQIKALSGQVKGLSSQVTALTNQLIKSLASVEKEKSTNGSGAAITLKIAETGGVAYTRWARTVCENDAYVVYKGHAASSRSSDQGSDSQLLCLHEFPQYYRTVVGNWAPVFNVEYRNTDGLFNTQNNGGRSLNNHNMPCVVCYAPTRSQQIMIPSQMVCPEGWTSEYFGFLMCPNKNSYRGAHSCVDVAPEAVPGTSQTNENSNGQQPMEARCPSAGGLSCPPYTHGGQLTCVVCTK